MFGDEQVPMPPVGKPALARMGEAIVELLQPTMLTRPESLDVLTLVDTGLQKHGIDVYPVDDADIPGSEGETDPTLDRPTIYIRKSDWDALERGGARARRPRATVIHELAHALLHVPVLRRRIATQSSHLLRRVSTETIPAYRQPEWQAWCLAGAILMPVSVLRSRRLFAPAAIAEAMDVSEDFAYRHLKRYVDLLRGGLG